MVGLDRGRQGRIARNKKARTGRASWVFRRLSETGLDSYLVGRGHLNQTKIVAYSLGFVMTLILWDTAWDTRRYLLNYAP